MDRFCDIQPYMVNNAESKFFCFFKVIKVKIWFPTQNPGRLIPLRVLTYGYLSNAKEKWYMHNTAPQNDIENTALKDTPVRIYFDL